MWPKNITVKGISIQVENLEELDDFIQRYGNDVTEGNATNNADAKPRRKSRGGSLATNHRVLLQQFVQRENKGMLNKDLGKFLGASGKAIGPALRKWALEIGLAHDQTAQAFERFSRPEGRGYKLTGPFLSVAKAMIEEQ